MEISIKWKICRVCLQEEKKANKKGENDNSAQFVHLFDKNKKLASQIFELSGISMKPDDSLPNKICNKCLTIVNNAVQFRKTCRSSNTYLQSILERTKSASSLLKPDISRSQTNNDDGFNEDAKTQASTLNDELEHNDEQNEIMTVSNNKSRDNTQTAHTLYSLEQQSDDIELELHDDVSDYTVELEEIIEMSDGDEVVTGDTDDPNSAFENVLQTSKENLSLNKFGNSQKLSADDKFRKQRNGESVQYNSQETELVELNKISQVDCNNSDEYLKENEDSVSERYVEFVSVDQEENSESNSVEAVVMDAEEQQVTANEDQGQVSSTVDTKEEIEYYEENSNISNLSNDMDKERLISANCSNSNVQKHSTVEKNKSQSPIIFSKRKIKRKYFKSAAYEPVQVCVCEICGNRFTDQNKMKLHMKIHLQCKSHQCELCFKSFITACNLQAHMRIHTGEKPFECKYCNRRFNDRSSHIRHERTHTNEKPFECFDCGKSFTLATTLQNHMKVHSNERSYRCEPCGKSFKLPHHLKKHKSTSLHRTVLQNTDDES